MISDNDSDSDNGDNDSDNSDNDNDNSTIYIVPFFTFKTSAFLCSFISPIKFLVNSL